MNDDNEDSDDLSGLTCRAVEYDGRNEGVPGPCLCGGFGPAPDWEEYPDC